jgi:hypothetical protein
VNFGQRTDLELFTVATKLLLLTREQSHPVRDIDEAVPLGTELYRYITVSTSHKAQTIGTTRHLYALRPLVHSASYRPGRHTLNLDVNLRCSHSHEASLGPIDSLGVCFRMQLSRLGSGLEAFSHNPSGGSITALFDRTTVDTRDLTWEFLSYYPILLSSCTGPRAHSPSVG